MQRRDTRDIDAAEPSRASAAVLIVRLITLLIVTDLMYVLFNYFLMKMYFLQTPLPFDLHNYIVFILGALHIVKSFFQISVIIKIVMNWLGNSYLISDNHLIQRNGIFTIIEKIYNLDNVRSVIVHQSILGKALHFGDVVIETSASGGYMDKITLAGVADPQKFEHKIRHRF